MSTPTDSTGPVAPSGTSNPVPLRGWFTSIIDWIKGLSPAGSTVYDTGRVTVPLATGFTGDLWIRRVGMEVDIFGTVSTSIAAGTVVLPVASGGIPAALRPQFANRPCAMFGGGAPMFGEVGVNGSITVRNAHTAAIASYRIAAHYSIGMPS